MKKHAYAPATTPMSQQREALVAIRAQPPDIVPDDVFGLLMDMGTGKSKVILDDWGEMAMSGGPRNLLVTAPAGSYRNWYEDKSDLQRAEINVHLDPALREKMVTGAWVSGGGARTRDSLRRLMAETKRPRALFINVEALSTVERAQELCEEFLSQPGFGYMAVDESTRIKNYKSKRTKAVSHIGAEASVRRILSGLVTPRSPMDLYAQFNFLDWRILGFRSYFAFRSRYAVMRKMDVGGRKFDVIVGHKNVEELQQKIAPWSYRVLKEDCLDLPEKTYLIRDVEQTDEQRRMYKELREFATTAVGGTSAHVSTTMVIQQIMKMHQINCGFVVDEERVLHELPERRTAALLEVLDEHEGKAVVWTPYDYTVRKLVKVLGEEYGPRAVAAFWGGNKSVRGAEERRFLGDPECRFIVATPAAGGIGNNWTVADLVVYYANTHDLELRSQSEDRTHRKGQLSTKMTYVDLVCRGTVDEKILRSLRNKIDMATLITGEGYRQWII